MLDLATIVLPLLVLYFILKLIPRIQRIAPYLPIMDNPRGRGRGMLVGGRRIPVRRGHDDRPNPPPVRACDYERTPQDCFSVRQTLAQACRFPPEIVDIVMDAAEYWACSTTTVDYTGTRDKHLAIKGGGRGSPEDQFLLRSQPLGLTGWRPSDEEIWHAEAPPRRLEEEYPSSELEKFIGGPKTSHDHPARKIVFEITSSDQGWGGDHSKHHTYDTSATWFDAGLDRFDMKHQAGSQADPAGEDNDAGDAIPTGAVRSTWPLLNDEGTKYQHQLHPDPAHLIQKNLLAARQPIHHEVEWSWADNIDAESTVHEDIEKAKRGRPTGDADSVRSLPEPDNAGEALEQAGRGKFTLNGEFVRNLKLGDMVTVWGRARYGGWANYVEKVTMKVYWAL